MKTRLFFQSLLVIILTIFFGCDLWQGKQDELNNEIDSRKKPKFTITMNKSVYEVNEDIIVNYSKVSDKDDKWMGIYAENNPQDNPLELKSLPKKEKEGSITFNGISSEGSYLLNFYAKKLDKPDASIEFEVKGGDDDGNDDSNGDGNNDGNDDGNDDNDDNDDGDDTNLNTLPKLTYKGLASGLRTDSEEIYNTDMIHPTIIRAKDHIENPLGTYYMYYSPHTHKGISMAYSDSLDGPWTQYANNPVIAAHAAPDIRWISKAGKYYMWIHTSNSHTDLWTTTDGINFKDEGIVAVHCDKIGTRNATYTRVYEHNNKYIMLYSGMDVAANLRSIYIAYSDDAKNWTQVKTPLVKPSPGENNEIFGPSFLRWGNKNLIVYQDNTGGKGGNLKCVIVNDNFDDVGSGGERHTLLVAPDDSPVNGRFRGAEFYKFSNTLYMFSGASKRFKENIIYATAPM